MAPIQVRDLTIGGAGETNGRKFFIGFSSRALIPGSICMCEGDTNAFRLCWTSLESSASKEGTTMKITAIVDRYLLGLLSTVFGLSGLLHFVHQPRPKNLLTHQFLSP
jgi:hypothetical protein